MLYSWRNFPFELREILIVKLENLTEILNNTYYMYVLFYDFDHSFLSYLHTTFLKNCLYYIKNNINGHSHLFQSLEFLKIFREICKFDIQLF